MVKEEEGKERNEMKNKQIEKKEGGKGQGERTSRRVRASHVTWPEPVSGAALAGVGDDEPRHRYRFRWLSLPVADR